MLWKTLITSSGLSHFGWSCSGIGEHGSTIGNPFSPLGDNAPEWVALLRNPGAFYSQNPTFLTLLGGFAPE